MRSIARSVAAATVTMIAVVTASLVIGAQPAAAADTCDSKTSTYKLSSFRGWITLKICHNKHYVKTVHAEIWNRTGWAVYGTLRVADNHNNAWDSARTTVEPDGRQGVHWDVNRNWPNGWRACAVFKLNNVMPPPQGHACIKVEGGDFKDD